MQKISSTITSYDLIKSFALIIMIVDHIGAYFFPEHLWWKSVGRIGFPVWFFLVGYARSTAAPFKLWGSGLFLIAIDALYGRHIFPLNALVTIFLMRITRKFYCHSIFTETILGYVLCMLIFLFALIPSSIAFEYGSLAFVFGLFGYAVRQNLSRPYQITALIGAIISFSVIQTLSYDFDHSQNYFMVIGSAIVTFILFFFKAKDFNWPVPSWTLTPLRFMGRYTLEIYVVHLTLFVMAVYYLKHHNVIPLLTPITWN